MQGDTAPPRLRAQEADMALIPWVDPENFNPGYLMHSMHLMPRSLEHQPSVHSQDYWMERRLIPEPDLDDGCPIYE